MSEREHREAGSDEQEGPSYVLVPPDALSPDALAALVEEFVTREGTDYGLREYTLEEKAQGVRRQIDRGEVVIAFDIEAESATLLKRTDLPRDMRKTSDDE